jgi:pimeloyl-ACP methyl ester carboxylesterase
MTYSSMRSQPHRVPNGDGWELALVQSWDEAVPPLPGRPPGAAPSPVLIVPGYGMNSFIFSYHPRGLSLEGYLASRGLEVWRVDLRGQGDSVSRGGGEQYALEDLALHDLEAAVGHVLAHSRTGASTVSIVGASLGGTLMFIQAVLGRRERLARLVAIGSPLRWVEINPVLRAAFSSPTLIGLVRFRGSRKLAELALPYLARFTPWILSVYMNREVTDIGAAREMVKTVEDPNRFVNRQIAEWIRDRDLMVNGTNVSEALARVDLPLMCVLANADGIVPRATAIFPYHQIGSRERQLLEVGEREIQLAHADLFVSNHSQEQVFRPVADWLLAPAPAPRGDGGGP